MLHRSPLARLLLGLGLVCGGIISLAGTLGLGGAGLMAVLIAGAVSAALAAGLARETPGATRATVFDAAVRVGAATVCFLLLVTGTAVVAGGVVATLVTGLAAVAALTWWLLHRGRGRLAHGRHTPPSAGLQGGTAAPAPPVLRPVPTPDSSAGPVPALSTSDLGREWLRTTAVLGRRLEPVARAALVRRREEVLDELERRDPVGFARWIAAGPALGSDPAAFVHGTIRGDRPAGTDAA